MTIVYVVQTEDQELIHVGSSQDEVTTWIKTHGEGEENFEVTAVTVDSGESPPGATTYDAQGPLAVDLEEEEDEDEDDD